VSNETIAAFFPSPPGEKWTPKWVGRRLGIRERRNAFDFEAGRMRPGYHDLDNSESAARAALEAARIAADDIDQVIYATSTPEYLMPDPACLLHRRLGLRPDAAAIGATAVGCGGFIYVLDLADSGIRAGKYRTVLLVGSVSIGPYIEAIAETGDREERDRLLGVNLTNAYIFGEGAGAMVLQATEDDGAGILETYTGACNEDNPVVFAAGGSRHPATHETVSQGLHRFDMDVRLVRDVGPKHFAHTIQAIVMKAGVPLDKIDRFIFHQVNARLLRRIADGFGIPWEKVEVHVEHYGNLDTATLPVAYHEARAEARIAPGDLVLFAAIGAGWQYGAALVRV
jgi:3-oxoacyl-[acyl-carrier-protein] synthase-3